MGPAAALITSAAASPASAGESFYAEPGLFSTRPDETTSLTTIDRFGPVGIGIEFHHPAFVMKVKNVEEGSSAAVLRASTTAMAASMRAARPW
jgi:hypothetical protein